MRFALPRYGNGLAAREPHISSSDLRVELAAESATMFATARMGYSPGETEVLVGTGRRHVEAGLPGFGHFAVGFPADPFLPDYGCPDRDVAKESWS